MVLDGYQDTIILNGISILWSVNLGVVTDMTDARHAATRLLASTIASLLILVTVVPASSAAPSATDDGPDPIEGPCVWVYPEDLWVVVDPDCILDHLLPPIGDGTVGAPGETVATVEASPASASDVLGVV